MKRKTADLSCKYFNGMVDYWAVRILILPILFLSISGKSQTTSYTQFNNELQLVRALDDKLAAEIYLGSAFSSTPTDKKVLSTNIQRYLTGWIHYYYSPRWKLSSSLAYYYNKDVPDIGQYYSPEWRLSLQGMYYIHKTGYTLLTRMRFEFRYMMNQEGVYVDKYRYRQNIKFTKPINGKVLRKGVVYFLASEEVYFNLNTNATGLPFFDRNRFETGGGYLITDDIQVELTYVNEFVPRDTGNEIYNTLSFTATFNNPFSNIKKGISSLSPKNKQED
jgi:hypothetical protein